MIFQGRFFCVLLGYLFGCFLTADVVARLKTGKTAESIGTKNPGSANIAAQLGPGWGLLALLGDVAKTAIPCFLCRYLLFPQLGGLAILYAGLGAAIGHDYPFWNRFHGGLGVAATCAFYVFYSPLWGTLACLAGAGVALGTRYLLLGALVIPALYLPPIFLLHGVEPGCVAAAALVLMLVRDFSQWRRLVNGEAEKARHPAWLHRK